MSIGICLEHEPGLLHLLDLPHDLPDRKRLGFPWILER